MTHPPAAARRWLGPVTVVVAWSALVVAVAHPPHGIGVDVCWIKAATGVPCPGCGLTRSLSCAARGMIDQSVREHPMGLVVFGMLSAVAAWSVLPARARAAVVAAIEHHPRVADVAYFAFVTAFVACGVARAVIHLSSMRV